MKNINAQHNLVLFNFDEKIGDYEYRESSQSTKVSQKSRSELESSSTQTSKPSKPKQLYLFEF